MNFNFLHPEISSRIEKKLLNGDYDGAIYDSIAYLEVKLQKIGETKSINTTLVKEVFENNKVQISSDKDRNVGAQELFSGVFRLIRNDRGHDKNIEEKAEIPCENKDDCLKYLGFISLLILYLERNIALKPIIDSHKVSLNIELLGSNFTSESSVHVNNEIVPILSLEPTQILISLPKKSKGIIWIKNNQLTSNSIEYSIPASTHENQLKIIATNIKLFIDKETKIERQGITGTKLIVYEKGRQYTRISPTKIQYSVGDYVTHQFDRNETCDESWYKDPLDGELVKYAWTGSALFNGEVIGKEKSLKPIKLSIKPEKIVSGLSESRLLRAIIVESDGILNIERDVSSEVQWQSENENIAYINKEGFLILKELGSTSILCKYKSLHDKINIEVITPTKGMKVKYFSSDIKRYQNIRFDKHDNLFISNQSSSVYKLTSKGLFKEILHLPNYEDPKYGLSDNQPSIDRLEVCPNQNIYINCSRPRSVQKFENSRLNHVLNSTKPLKGIVTDSKGVIYIANMDNEIIKIKKDKSTEILPIQIHSLDLRLLDDDNIIVGSAGGGDVIHIYSTSNGKLQKSIISPFIKVPTDFAVKNKEVYVACFHSGDIYKLDLNGNNHTKIAEGFDIIGGIDFDNSGNLYVAIFDSPDNSNVCIYKIYL